MADLFIQVAIGFAIFVACLACLVSLLKSGAREDEAMERHYEELAPLAPVIPLPLGRDRSPRRPAA